MFRVLLVVFLIGFVSGVGVDFDCPDKIYAGEEFECNVDVIDGEATYDLKVEVDEERDSVLRIWDGEVWKSGYYYVNDFVRRSEVVKLIIEEEGKYDVVVKLRDGEWRSEFDVGRLKVLVGEVEEEEMIGVDSTDFVEEDSVIPLGGDEIISLNEDVVEDEEWDYVSKDGKVVDWLPYLFCLFLICLVGVLVWDKF
ncbi:MAG: hypothetical protein V1888_02740 [archaeon]